MLRGSHLWVIVGLLSTFHGVLSRTRAGLGLREEARVFTASSRELGPAWDCERAAGKFGPCLANLGSSDWDSRLIAAIQGQYIVKQDMTDYQNMTSSLSFQVKNDNNNL